MKPFQIAGLPADELNRFLAGTHSDPFRILGPHRVGDDLEVRVFRPDARKIDIVLNQQLKEPIAGREFTATVSSAQLCWELGATLITICASQRGTGRSL